MKRKRKRAKNCEKKASGVDRLGLNSFG